MRYHELLEAKPWRRYTPFAERRCTIADLHSGAVEQVLVRCGTCSTGRQRVFAGYYFEAALPAGVSVLGEDPRGLRRAMRMFESGLNTAGWTVDVIGLSSEWHETGLSADSGFGYHPNFSGPVHILHPSRHALLLLADGPSARSRHLQSKPTIG